jgi:cyanophycin synthetase
LARPPDGHGAKLNRRDIRILGITELHGPNLWTYRPVIEALVDIGELEDFPSNTLPGFADRLAAWLPGLVEHHCSYGERGGFLRRLREGTWPGHILEHVTLELQNLIGLPAGFGKARETSTRGVYKVVVRSWHPRVSIPALHAARKLVMAAIEDQPFDLGAAIGELKEIADSACLGPSTACIVDAADDRDIPAIRLNDGNLVQLGYGARQRRIWTAETELTSAIAEGVSRDKDLTKQLLSSVGIPVPEGRMATDAQDAWLAANEIGLPVVVKPSDGNHGRGVFTNLHTREQVDRAFAVAEQEGSAVIVERFVPGNEHRLLIVGGKLAAAARGESAWVCADGVHTIRELIDLQLNSDPRRGRNETNPLNPVRIDSAARIELSNQGFDADSVPVAGTRVLIQRNGNVAIDVTDRVHPSVAAAASLAARVVGLDIAGVDLVIEDVSRDLLEQRGAIVEVNAGPGLLMHIKPAEGQPRPVGRAIVDHLFPSGDQGRIPVVGITGSRGTRAISLLVHRFLHLAGRNPGLACSAGLFVENRRIDADDCSDRASGVKLLVNRLLESAVIENPAATIASEGLAYDRCSVAVVTGVDEADAMPARDIRTAEQIYNVLRTQVDVVLPEGAAVLNATDPLAVRMAPLSDGEVLFYSASPGLPAIDGHRARGGRTVHLREQFILLARGASETILANIDSIPAIAGAAPAERRTRIEIALASAAAGWALGIEPETLRAGLETWETTEPVSDTPPAQTQGAMAVSGA